MILYNIYNADFKFILSEIILIIFIILTICFFTLLSHKIFLNKFSLTYTVIIYLLFILSLYIWLQFYQIDCFYILFNFSLSNIYIFKNFKILLSFFIILHLYSFISFKSFNLIKTIKFEYIYIISFILIASIFLILSNDFLGMFLNLELQNFCFYILLSLQKKKKIIAEISIKYYIFGCISSGFILYGISLIYAWTGQLNFSDLSMILSYQNITNFPIILVFYFFFLDFFLN